MAHEPDPATDLQEALARALYLSFGGSDEAYLHDNEQERRVWRIPGTPWDRQADQELCEHERDDWRIQARTLLERFAEPENAGLVRMLLNRLDPNTTRLSEEDARRFLAIMDNAQPSEALKAAFTRYLQRTKT